MLVPVSQPVCRRFLEDEPCGCMVNAWNAKWEGTGIDCIPNRTHIARYSKFNRARLFAELEARQ